MGSSSGAIFYYWRNGESPFAAPLDAILKGGLIESAQSRRAIPEHVLELRRLAMTLKLKRTPGLYLVGFMASGKTTVGRALAAAIGWPFVDLDTEIEKQEGLPIGRIFSERGEAHFRKAETEALRLHVARVKAGHPSVIALGGGAFVQPGNRELLESGGVTLWLDCPFDLVSRRLGDDTTRPLAIDRARLESLFIERRPLYEQADYRVEANTDDLLDILQRILVLPIF
jgi:shikimate kinase